MAMMRFHESSLANLFVFVCLGAIAYFVFLCAPIYMENKRLHRALEGFALIPDLAEKAPDVIKGDLIKAMAAESVSKNRIQDLQINYRPKSVDIVFEYEVRKHYIFNLDFVLSFHEKKIIQYD